MQNEVYWIPTFIFFQNTDFRNRNSNFSIFQQRNSKKNLTGIFGIKNGIGIPLSMGVPEIGTKNWNSQPSFQLGGFLCRQSWVLLPCQVSAQAFVLLFCLEILMSHVQFWWGIHSPMPLGLGLLFLNRLLWKSRTGWWAFYSSASTLALVPTAAFVARVAG